MLPPHFTALHGGWGGPCCRMRPPPRPPLCTPAPPLPPSHCSAAIPWCPHLPCCCTGPMLSSQLRGRGRRAAGAGCVCRAPSPTAGRAVRTCPMNPDNSASAALLCVASTAPAGVCQRATGAQLVRDFPTPCGRSWTAFDSSAAQAAEPYGRSIACHAMSDSHHCRNLYEKVRSPTCRWHCEVALTVSLTYNSQLLVIMLFFNSLS